jgi:hypothetical protein
MTRARLSHAEAITLWRARDVYRVHAVLRGLVLLFWAVELCFYASRGSWYVGVLAVMHQWAAWRCLCWGLRWPGGGSGGGAIRHTRRCDTGGTHAAVPPGWLSRASRVGSSSARSRRCSAWGPSVCPHAAVPPSLDCTAWRSFPTRNSATPTVSCSHSSRSLSCTVRPIHRSPFGNRSPTPVNGEKSHDAC